MTTFAILMTALCFCFLVLMTAMVVSEYFCYSNELSSYKIVFKSLRNLQKDATLYDLNRKAILSWLKVELDQLENEQENKARQSLAEALNRD